MAAASGEALDSMDDDRHWWDTWGKGIYIGSTAVAVGTSLWVIFISSHLTSLTRDSATRPKIKKAREILEVNVRDVRGMLWLALLSLLVSCTATAWLNLTTQNSIIFSAALLLLVWQALLKKDDVTAAFKRECGEDWGQEDDFRDMVVAFLRPWQQSCIVRVCCWLCCCGGGGAAAGAHVPLREEAPDRVSARRYGR